jgi:hypothetical protein
MNIGKLIFSNRFSYRLARHLLFWIVYCTFFFIQSLVPSRENDFFTPNMYMIALTSVFCFMPACALLFYTALYVIWPVFMKQKRYGASFVAVVAMFAVAVGVNYFFSGIFYSSYYVLRTTINFGTVFSLAYLNSIWAVTLMGLALFIKLSKECFIQQRLNVEMTRKKMRTDLNIEKSRLQPAYLYSSLNNIQSKIIHGTDESDQMILKLSDVLSYTLYECDAEFVPVNTELAALIDFIDLERMKNNGKEQIHIEWDAQEEFLLPPMLILSFLQEVVTTLKQYGKLSWQMSINISGTSDVLSIIVNGNTGNGFPDFTDPVRNMLNRLDSVYSKDGYLLNYSTGYNNYTLSVQLFEDVRMKQTETAEIYL